MLVLVMTLLGILFVVGVAFLATMNFEADMISAQKLRSQGDNFVDAAMVSSSVPFGDLSAMPSGFIFAEMPGVDNSFSSNEPYYVSVAPGPDLVLNTPDDEQSLAWGTYFDAQAHAGGSFTGLTTPGYFAIDTNLANGANVERMFVQVPGAPTATEITLGRCQGGVSNGQYCDVTNPCPPPGQCEYPRVADADGDGIVDSLLVDASVQLAGLAPRVNPPSNLSGRVSLALRIVPHGGMVNLNDSHPLLIQGVFDLLPTNWPAPPTNQNVDPNISFRHGPTQDLIAYSPTVEESSLRRRGIIPPREFQPSLLHGNPFSADAASSGAHMPRQLFWWLRASGQQDAFAADSADANGHRFTPFSPTEPYPDEINFSYWSVMMEPSTANQAGAAPPPWNPPPPVGTGTDLAYDRRHLATTVSHDDSLARTAMVSTPRGKEDLRRAMIEANWPPPGLADPDKVVCDPLLPFEYLAYPATIANAGCCLEDVDCVPSPLKGRMQLSLPWIDDELATANALPPGPDQDAYKARIYRTIHDVFFMLVRNATQAVEVEGMICEFDRDCSITDTVCLLNGNPVPPGQEGYCVHSDNPVRAMFTNPSAPNGPGCLSAAGCVGIPGSICREDGICTLTAPAWSDVECNTDAACRTSEFCMIAPGATIGLCADRWTRQRRSEALVSRTAASLTANLVDFADNDGDPNDPSDDAPTPVAVRDFEFTTKCENGTYHNLPCPAFDCVAGGGEPCPIRPISPGRDIDVDPANNGGCDTDAQCTTPQAPVCSLNKVCIQPLYVYGLEYQPYITEVATFADGPNPGPNVVGRAIELFNPYDAGIILNNKYYIIEAPPTSTTLAGLTLIPLTGTIPANIGNVTNEPFAVYATATTPLFRTTLLNPPKGLLLAANGDLTFLKDWTIYLVQTSDPNDPTVPKIVVDQFKVGETNHHVGEEGPGLLATCDPTNGPPCRFSVQRVVSAPPVATDPATVWTWTVPAFDERPDTGVTLGTWNGTITPPTGVQKLLIHPVEANFANTGLFGAHFGSMVGPAFPTTGSLSLLMRHANRASTDFTPTLSPGGTPGKNTDLAFTTQLIVSLPPRTVKVANPPPATGFQSSTVTFKTEEEIDNGRMPLFDVGKVPGTTPPGIAGVQSMHHLAPSLFKAWDPTDPTSKAAPGDLNTLPWGQLVFDYFTALPLSNGGPYDIDPAANYLSLPEMPRVDQGGLRVHGRININAAPWKVLSGLPFVPMNQIPAAFQAKIDGVLQSPDPTMAQPLGPDRAQAIVAYRDARGIVNQVGDGTGNYDDGSPVPPGVAGTPLYGRGWTNPAPAARRGTGFMSVGEMANIRHDGASALPTNSTFRFDSGVIGSDPDKNKEDFIEAAAVLIALGDWVSVRSQVFTVYGMIRGADDDTLVDPNDPIAVKQAIQVPDTDSRAIRFQETIDRLPVLQGQPRPKRIGERTVGRYTDVNSD